MNKIKHLFTLLLYCALGLSFHLKSFAGPISRDAALQKAVHFMLKNNMIGTSNTIKAQSIGYANAPQPFKHCFIFNAPQQGYVIVSGDDRTRSILGYSNEGHLDINNLPENMRGWLGNYEEQIDNIPANIQSKTNEINNSTRFVSDPARKAIPPLLSSIWNQNSPYNDSVPAYWTQKEGHGRCAAGCVATALAQVMYFHKWPAATTSDIKGYDNQNQFDKNGETYHAHIAGVPKGTNIYWDLMLDNYNGGRGTEEERAACAGLLRYVGASVHMNYGPSSGAFSGNVATALKNYFDYSPSTQYKNHRDYSLKLWEDMLYNELTHSRPVYYAGYSKDAGHAFVCDGYDGKGLYHINWGWGGSSNGYFVLSVLNPYDTSGIGSSSSSYGYGSGQEMVIGAKPKIKGENAEQNRRFNVNFTLIRNNNELIVYLFNKNMQQLECEWGFGLYTANGEIVPIYTAATKLNPYYSAEEKISLTPDMLADLDDGTYYFETISREKNALHWILASDNRKSLIVEKKEGKITCKLYPEDSKVRTLSMGPRNGSFAKNEMEYVATVAAENGDYTNNLFLFIYKDKEKKQEVHTAYTSVGIKSNSKSNVSFFFTIDEPGKYYTFLSTSQQCKNVIAADSIEVVEGAADASAVEIINIPGARPIVNDMLIDSLILKNKGEQPVLVKLNFWGGIENPQGQYPHLGKRTVALMPNEQKTLQLNFGEREPATYALVIGGLNGTKQYRLTMLPVITYWDGDGKKSFHLWNNGRVTIPDSVGAVKFCEKVCSRIRRVRFSHNPNTIYYWADKGNAPSYLKNKYNIVQHGQSDSIYLEDGKNCYVPYAFNTKQISYSRTISHTAYKQQNWESMVIPFTPTSILRSDNGEEIHWTNASSPNGVFYLKELSGLDEQGQAIFDDTKEMMANTPYLIAIKPEMKDVKMTFKAGETKVLASNLINTYTTEYIFTGLLGDGFLNNGYALNKEGSAFVQENKAHIKAFRAAFAQNICALSFADIIPIITEGVEPIIDGIANTKSIAYPNVYNLAGQCVLHKANKQQINTLPTGIYIVNGKKIFIK